MEEEEEKDNAIGHELPCNWEQFINLSRQTTRQQSGESPSLLFSLTLRSQRRPSSHGGREGEKLVDSSGSRGKRRGFLYRNVTDARALKI